MNSEQTRLVAAVLNGTATEAERRRLGSALHAGRGLKNTRCVKMPKVTTLMRERAIALLWELARAGKPPRKLKKEFGTLKDSLTKTNGKPLGASSIYAARAKHLKTAQNMARSFPQASILAALAVLNLPSEKREQVVSLVRTHRRDASVVPNVFELREARLTREGRLTMHFMQPQRNFTPKR